MCALSCNLRSRQWQSKEGVSPRNTLSNPKPLVEFRAIHDKCYYNNSNKYKENVLKQSYFRVSCSWSIETVPYWYDHNKYYTMNKHEQQGLALWGHITNSYCFKKELHCIQFTLTERGNRAELIHFWDILMLYIPATSGDYKMRWFQWKRLAMISIKLSVSQSLLLPSSLQSFISVSATAVRDPSWNSLSKMSVCRTHPEALRGLGHCGPAEVRARSDIWLINSTPLYPFLIPIFFALSGIIFGVFSPNFTCVPELFIFILQATKCFLLPVVKNYIREGTTFKPLGN